MKTLIKRSLAVWLVAAFVSVSAWAGDASAPQALVKQTADKVLKILNDNPGKAKNDPQFLYGLVDKVILPVVDFNAMSKLILGVNWRSATPQQRSDFQTAFQTLLVRTYTRSLAEYSGKTIRYLPSRPSSNPRFAQVDTEILQGSGKPNLPVTYRLIKTRSGDWKVYDIVIDGLSLVTNYRSTYQQKIATEGLEALIKEIQALNKKAAQGNSGHSGGSATAQK
ncbi:MAG: ABC transporter substrate-binding protein [Gammaproteobacteria bacterium]